MPTICLNKDMTYFLLCYLLYYVYPQISIIIILDNFKILFSGLYPPQNSRLSHCYALYPMSCLSSFFYQILIICIVHNTALGIIDSIIFDLCCTRVFNNNSIPGIKIFPPIVTLLFRLIQSSMSNYS